MEVGRKLKENNYDECPGLRRFRSVDSRRRETRGIRRGITVGVVEKNRQSSASICKNSQ